MTALLDELRLLIASEGPMPVDRFMALALAHPRHGYYMTRDPFGAAGDFTTAPEISQVFGELLGLWAASIWQAMGEPDPVLLVELGPGRGTLMADAMRAARALPAFRASIALHLIETSPVLRDVQRRLLAAQDIGATWHLSTETLPPGPAIVLANEFFDALPIRQFVRTPRGVFERLVGLDDNGALAFGLSPDPIRDAPPGADPARDLLPFEIGFAGRQLMQRIANRLREQGGAALVLDYGHTQSGLGDTLQGVRRHAAVSPLSDPGETDVTAHVDFAALRDVAVAAGAAVHGPCGQGTFLRALGLETRIAALSRTASPAQAAALTAAAARLSGPAPGMGHLFKAMAVTHPALPQPAGFSEDAAS